jgi:hypothetical protein
VRLKRAAHCHWDIGFIRPLMIYLGLISSLFGFRTAKQDARRVHGIVLFGRGR